MAPSSSIEMPGASEPVCVCIKPRPIVVVVDADKGTRRLLRQILEPQAYRVFEADNAGRGLEEAVQWRPDPLETKFWKARDIQFIDLNAFNCSLSDYAAMLGCLLKDMPPYA